MNRVTQAYLRRSVVLAVRGGMSQTQASQAFGVSVRAANKWVAIDRAGGLRALRLKRRGRRAGEGRLNREQANRIWQLIIDALPDQMKLPFNLWTRAAVVSLIDREYGIAVSLTTASRYLQGWGMSVHGPLRRAGERDNAATTRWLRHEYPTIACQAKRDNAVIYWANEVGLRREHVVGVSDSLPGQASIRRFTTRRMGLNMISAMTNRGHLGFMVLHGKFDVPQFIQFMQRLLKQAGTKVYLIVESHPVHRSRSVKRFVTTNAAQIRLIHLLNYSSERKSDELLVDEVKINTVRGRGAILTGHLQQQQGQPRVIHSHSRDKYVRHPV